MELEEFLEYDQPIKYNFELENKSLKEKNLDTFKRYFIYKANSNSCYTNGKAFAEEVEKEFGVILDCDGTLGNNGTCNLARKIYRTLWKWSDSKEGEEGELQCYGNAGPFENFGPDTMNSAQTIVNKIVDKAYSECKDDNIKNLKKESAKISVNFIVELFSNDCSKEKLMEWLTASDKLESYLDAYHTLGNFVLVPAYFNSYRGLKVQDFWDKSLTILKKENGHWSGFGNKVKREKKLYVRYINYFFLWDYTQSCESYEPKILSDFSDDNTLDDFLDNTVEKIERRGNFMLAMLKINRINTKYYKKLVKKIFNTDKHYAGYEEVIKDIKMIDEKAICSESEVNAIKTVINALETELKKDNNTFSDIVKN